MNNKYLLSILFVPIALSALTNKEIAWRLLTHRQKSKMTCQRAKSYFTQQEVAAAETLMLLKIARKFKKTAGKQSSVT